MKIQSIEFHCSSPSLAQCPRDEMPEFAFIGRSNVGKSSLINRIAERKALAKVSGTPGKTRMINHFLVQSTTAGVPVSWFLVDLPGYGFAKISKTQREKFGALIQSYLNKRFTLALTFLLVDSRHAPLAIDLEFMDWLGDHEIGFVILMTKTDKLSKSQILSKKQEYEKALAGRWAELPLIIPTSAETGAGRDEILEIIGQAIAECG